MEDGNRPASGVLKGATTESLVGFAGIRLSHHPHPGNLSTPFPASTEVLVGHLSSCMFILHVNLPHPADPEGSLMN